MDLKSKGRTWVGNIYHKLETICQEVDDFVTKDTIKYVENQVQTVGESVKKIYSNVVHDVHSPLEDNKQGKAEAVTKTQNNAAATNVQSMAGIKEKHKHASERESIKKQDIVNLKNCDPSAMDHLGQFSLPPSTYFPDVAENDSHLKETRDAVICSNTEVVLENNFMREDYTAASQLSFPKDENSSDFGLHWREQQLTTENLESPVDGNSSGPSDFSNDRDPRKIVLAEFSPRNLVEDMGLRTSLKDKTCKNTDHSEDADTGLFPKQDTETEDADSNTDPAEEAETNLSLQHEDSVGFVKHGVGLVAIVGKEHLVVDNRSYPSYESSSDLSLHPREKHPEPEDSNSLQDSSLCTSFCTSTNEDYCLTILAKLSPEASVNDKGVNVFHEEEGECNRPHCSRETVNDLSLDGYCSYMSSDYSVEESVFTEKHADLEYLGCLKDKSSCNEYLCSRKLHVETNNFSSPNGENSSGLSRNSRTEDHRNTILSKLSPVNSVDDAGLRTSKKDETACNVFSDVLSTNLSSELVSLGISWKHKVSATEASSSSVSTEPLDLLEFSHANSTKTEEVCCEYTDSSGCASVLSSSSCASALSSSSCASVLTSDKKAINLVPALRRTASSAGIVDDFFNDIADADMETINLSDKAELEESCIVVDNELLHAASCRPRNFRSYKKLIQEVFASRKRLIKEYELLPIWYGDIDTNTSVQSEQCLLPHITSASSPLQARNLAESEWELL